MDFSENQDVPPEKELISRDGEIPDGIVKSYSPEGKLVLTIQYKNNQIDGSSQTFYPDGNLQYDMIYQEDQPLAIKRFDGKGTLREEVTYKNGQIHCYKNYDKTGQISNEGCF